MKRRWIALCMAAVLVVGMSFGFAGCGGPKEAATETVSVDGDTLRVGIISDLQLAEQGGSDVYDAYFQKALEFLKNKEINVLMNLGDFTDVASEKAYENYRRIYETVYPAGGKQPVKSFVLGNHDYWLTDFVKCWEIPFKGKMRSRFVEYTGETSPWTHKVINGYHFIGFSPVNGDMGQDAYTEKLAWAEEQIKAAVADDPNKPVFVLTHNNPKDTVYMSGEEGCRNLDELFSKYPQVVSISGHTHAPLESEHSIVQKEYTAIQTQSLSYTCYEAGYSQIGTDNFEAHNPMCMIMEIKDGKITIQRYSILTGEAQKQPWVISEPVSKDTFTYTAARADQSAAPTWTQAPALSVRREGFAVKAEFNAASHEEFVYAYRLELINSKGEKVAFPDGQDENDKPKTKDSLLYVTDFSNGAENMVKRVSLKISDKTGMTIPAGTYTVNVYARDSWGHESAPQSLTVEL